MLNQEKPSKVSFKEKPLNDETLSNMETRLNVEKPKNTEKPKNIEKPKNTEMVKNAVTGVKNAVTGIKNAVMGVKNVETGIKNTEKPKNVEMVKNTVDTFFQVNTTISKFVFILLILIVFVMLFNVGLYILEYIYGSDRSPYIINGLIKSDVLKIVSSNPNVTNSVPIMRSVNEVTGLEYTWEVWVYIEEPYLNAGNKYKRIFSKGTHSQIEELNETYNTSFLNNSPGLYYNEDDNKLTLVFNTFSNDSNIYEIIDIKSTPIEKWIHVTITIKNKTVNVYINGILTKEHELKNIPKQNYYDTTVGDKKGFGGYISNLRYYDYAISDVEIQNNYLYAEHRNYRVDVEIKLF